MAPADSDSDLEIISPPRASADSAAPRSQPKPGASPTKSPARKPSNCIDEPDKPPSKHDISPKPAEAAESHPVKRRPNRLARARAPPSNTPEPLGALPNDSDDGYFNRSKAMVFRSKHLKGGLAAPIARIPGRPSTSASPAIGEAPREEEPVIDLDTDSDEAMQHGGSSSDEESGGEGIGRKKAKGKGKARSAMPSWTKAGSVPVFDLDDPEGDEPCGRARRRKHHNLDSDSSLELRHAPSASRTASGKLGKPGHRKPAQKKSRSRSPTPPPAVDPGVLLMELSKVRDTCNLRRPAPKPRLSEWEDEVVSMLDNDEDLDPGLAALRREIRAKVAQGKAEDRTGAAAAGEWDAAEGKGLLVKLKVSMVFDPRKSGSEKAIEVYERPIEVELRSKETLDHVFERVARQRGLAKQSLVLLFNDRRVYTSQTPEQLQIYVSADLKGYVADVWEHVREHRSRRGDSLQPAAATAATTTNTAAAPAPAPTPASREAGSEDGEDPRAGFKTITVRAGQAVDLEMTVKPTTSVLAIIRQFLKEMEAEAGAGAGGAAAALGERAKQCRLEFDGEALGHKARVQETEIDDGDVLDIVLP